MKRKIILLSGVHGVGKGYFLSKNFMEEDKFAIFEASELISRYKKADDAGYKKVKDVLNNQKVLLAALKIEQEKTREDIILDGHICMLNADGNIESIPKSFFADASVSGIVLLQDEAENIVKRQAERDGLMLEINVIRAMQEQELKYCKVLFAEYDIPYYIIDHACNYQQFCEIVSRM